MNNCTKCYSKDYCSICQDGYFYDDSTTSCSQCTDQNCAYCMKDVFDTSSNASMNCYVCKDGFMMDWQLEKCVDAPDCLSGYYYDSYWSKCSECKATDCASCNSNGYCSKCFDGYILDAETRTCEKKCSNPGTFWDKNTFSCQNCSMGCSSCKNNMTCGICQPGQSLIINKQNNTSQCIRCPKNCTSCISSLDENHQLKQVCTQCAPNFKIGDNKRCQPFNCSSPGFFYDSFYDTCLSCGKDCAACNGLDKCLKCAKDDGSMIINNGSCKSQCNAPGTFWNSSLQSCLNCNENIQNCSQCFYNSTQSKAVCSQCERGFKKSNGSCEAIDCNQTGVFQNGTVCDYCPYGCSNCTNPFTCSSCVSGMNLIIDNNEQGICTGNCSSFGEFFNITSGYCEPYDFGCLNGTQNGLCMGCGNGTMMVTRDVFMRSMGMLNGNGVQQQQRTMNNLGQHPVQINQDVQNGQFGQMINNGINIINQNSFRMDGQMLNQNQTNMTMKNGTNKIMLSNQRQQDQLKLIQNAGRCINCSRDCVKCQLGKDQQIQCLECRRDFKVHQNGTCVPRNFCEDGMYFNRMDQQCKRCDKGCSQCTVSSRNCSKCFDNFTLGDDQTCNLRCDRGSFWNNDTSSCQSCGNGCALCTSTLNCGQCQERFYMSSLNQNLTDSLSLPTSGFIPNGQCYGCPSNCTQCGPNPNNSSATCFQCAQGSKLIEGNCVPQSCGMNGTYFDSIIGKCVRCPRNCSQCINETACLTCNEPRFTLVNSTKCVDACNYKTQQSGQFYYFDNTTQTCIANTVKNCTRANSSSTCMQCQPGFGLNISTSASCEACSSNCTDCIAYANYTECRKCLPGFILNRTYNQCDKVNCTQNNTYPLNRSDSNSLCNLCPMGCGKCRGPELCLQCAHGFMMNLKAQRCEPICNEYQYFDNQTMQCVNCSSNCRKCKSKDTCMICESEYYLNYLNPFQETENLPIAQTCNSCPENCHFCFVNTTLGLLRRLDTNVTSFLQEQTPTCGVCNEGYQFKIDSCGFNGCKKENQYVDYDKGYCSFCPPGCSSCFSDQICSTCFPGFIFNSSSSLCDRNMTNFMSQNSNGNNMGGQNNNSMGMNGTMGMNGSQPINGSKPINGSQDMNGSQPMNGSKPMNGSQGTNGSMPINGSMPMNVSNQSMIQGQQLNCQINQFMDSINQQCKNCSKGCGLCDSKSKCYFCLDGFSLVSYFDLALMRNVSACRKDPVPCPLPSHYFDLEVDQCLPCQDGCDKCETREMCNICEEGKFELEIGRNIKKCTETCPQGYNGIYEEGRMQCQKCDEGCDYCNDKRCVQCSQGFQALRIGMGEIQCVRKCPVGHFVNRTMNTCEQCVPGCKQCNGPTPNNCSVCHDFLRDNRTTSLSYSQQMPIPTFCTPNCTNSSQFVDIEGVCQNCSENCTTCSRSPTNCTSCDSTMFFLDRRNMRCVPLNMTNNTNSSMCKKDQFFDPMLQNCGKCDQSCKNCNGPRESNCTQCADTLFAFRPNMTNNLTLCVKSCPNGTYHNFMNGTCQPCANNCTDCRLQLMSNKEQCLSCGPGAFFYNNSCIQSCPSGTFTKGTRCLDCSNNCSSCNETDCLTCKTGFQKIMQSVSDVGNAKLSFFGRNCTQIVTLPDIVGTEGICPTGTYFNTSLLYCDVCPKGCAACTSYTSCTSSCSVIYADDCADNSTNTITCQNPFILQSKNRTCVSECDDGQFVRNNTCQRCQLNCDQCLNPEQCLNCSRSFFKVIDQDSNTTRCVKDCSLVKTEGGHALFNDRRTNSCSPCQPGCAKCMNQSACEVCLPFTSFERGNCSCTFMYEVTPSIQLKQLNITLYGVNFYEQMFEIQAVPCSQILKLFNNNPQTSIFDNNTFFDEQEIMGLSPLDVLRCRISRVVQSKFSPKVQRVIPITSTIISIQNIEPEFIKGLISEKQLLRLNRRRIMPRNCEEPERSDYRIQFMAIKEQDDDNMLANNNNVFGQQLNMQQLLFQINSTTAQGTVDQLLNGQIQISSNKIMGAINQISNKMGSQDKISQNFNGFNEAIENIISNSNQNDMNSNSMGTSSGMNSNNMQMDNIKMLDSMNINYQGRSLQSNDMQSNMKLDDQSNQQMSYQNLGIPDSTMKSFISNIGSMENLIGEGQESMNNLQYGMMENLAKMMNNNMTNDISINNQDQKLYSTINRIRLDIKLTDNNIEVYKCQMKDTSIGISAITGFSRGIASIQWKVDIMKKQGGQANNNMFNAQSLRDLQQISGQGGMMPNGTMPNGTMPNGTMDGNGTMPNGTMGGNGTKPNETMPNGTMSSNGTMPNGTMANGTMGGNGTMPNGTIGGNGIKPNETMPNGTMSSNGTMPNGTMPNGTMGGNGTKPNGTIGGNGTMGNNGTMPNKTMGGNGTNNQTMQNMTGQENNKNYQSSTDLSDQEDEMNITVIERFLEYLELNSSDTTFIDFGRIFEILEDRTQRIDFNLTVIVYGNDENEYAIEKAQITIFNFQKQQIERPDVIEIVSTKNFTFKPIIKEQQCDGQMNQQKINPQQIQQHKPNVTVNCILANRRGIFIANLTNCVVPSKLLDTESEYLLIYFYSQNKRDKQQNGAVVLKTEQIKPMAKIVQGSAILVNPANITRLNAKVNKMNLTNYYTFWSCLKVEQTAMNKFAMCEFNLANYTQMNLTLPEFTMDFGQMYRFSFNIVDKKNLTIKSSDEIMVYTVEMNERRRVVSLMIDSDVDFYNYMNPLKEKQIISCNQTMMAMMNNATLNITYNLIEYVDGTKMRKVINKTEIVSNKLKISKGGLQQGSYYEAQCIVMDPMTIGMVSQRFTTISKSVDGLQFSINAKQGDGSQTQYQLQLQSNSSTAYQCSVGYVQPTLQTKVNLATIDDYVQNGNATFNTTLPYLKNGTLEVFAQCTDPSSGQPIYMSQTINVTKQPMNSTQVSALVSHLKSNASSMTMEDVLNTYYTLSADKDTLNSSSKATTYMALTSSIASNAANITSDDKLLLSQSLSDISQDLLSDPSLASNSKLIQDNIKAVMTIMNITNSSIKQGGALENNNNAISTYTEIDTTTFTNIVSTASNILSLIASNSTYRNQSKQLIQGLSEAAKQVSASLLSNESVNISNSEFAMAISKIQPSSAAALQQMSLGGNSSLSSVSLSLNVSDSTFANIANLVIQAMVVSKSVRSDSITPTKNTSYDDGTVSTVKTRLASDILVINTQKSDTETASDDGTFTLQSVTVSNLQTPLYFAIDAESTLADPTANSSMNCMYYDSSSSTWKQSECVATQDGASSGQTQCCSYHMTEFAIVETLTVRSQAQIDDGDDGESDEKGSFVVAVVIIFDIYLAVIGLIGFFLDKYRKLVLYNKMNTKPAEPQFQDLRKLQESNVHNDMDISERLPPTNQHNMANNPPSELIANKKKGKKQMKKDNRNLNNVSPQESEQNDLQQPNGNTVANPNQYYPSFNQQANNQAVSGMNERNNSVNSQDQKKGGKKRTDTNEYKEQRFEGGSEEEQEDDVAQDLSKDTKQNKKQRPGTGNKKMHKSIDTEKTKKNSNASSKQHLFDEDDDTSQNIKSLGKLSEKKKLGKTNPAKNSQDKMILHQDSDEDEEQYGEHAKTHGGLDESNQNINADENDAHTIPHDQLLSRSSLNNSKDGLVQPKNGLVSHPVVVRQMSVQKGGSLQQQEGPFNQPPPNRANVVIERTFASNPIGSIDKNNMESVKVKQNTCCDVYQTSLKVYNRVGGPVFSESPYYPRPLKTLSSVVQFFAILTLTGAFMTLASMNPAGSIIVTLILMRIIQVIMNLLPAKVLQKESRTVQRNIAVCVGYFILLILLHIFSLLMGMSADKDTDDMWKKAFVGAIFVELVLLDIILIPLFTTIMTFCCCKTKHFLAISLSMIT